MNSPSPIAQHERNYPVTTAPARPTLYGPDGQALASKPDPMPAMVDTGDWKPVRQDTGATVWERPRLEAAPEPVVDDASEQAEQILADARTEADRIIVEARSLRARTLGSADHDARTIRETAAAEVARKEQRGRKLDVVAGRAVIAGAVGLTAFGEYSLARLAHFPAGVAWLLPFVIDVYVIQAFRRHRDIAQAITLTIAANVVYHLAAAGMFGVTTDADNGRHATWWLIALVSSIASVILWRMHVMTAPPKAKKRDRGGRYQDDASAPVPAASTGPAEALEPVLKTSPQPATEAVPEAHPKAVPDPESVPPQNPVLKAVPAAPNHPVPARRKTGTKARKRQVKSSTAPGTGTARTKAGTAASTASFEEHVTLAQQWLEDDPNLSGNDIGKRLGTGDSYGRRVKRAATTQPAK